MRVGKRSAFKRIYSRYRPQIILAVVVLLLVTMMILSAVGVVNLPLFDTLARYTVVPVKNAFDTVGDSIAILFEDTDEIESQLIALKKENDQLRLENEQIAQLEQENERLRALLDFASNSPNQYIGAEVIARAPDTWFSNFTVDRGSADGVAAGMAVVTADGLAGVVTQVQEHTASVQAIVDAYASQAGMIERTRDQGIVSGLLSSQMEMSYLPQHADLVIGDRVLTTGLEGTYPSGLLIGTVSAILRDANGEGTLRVLPAVDFDHLEEVLILTQAEAAP